MEGMLAMAAHENAPTTDHGETASGTATARDRRRFLKGTLVAGSAAASLVGLVGSHVSMARAQGLQASAGVGARKTTTSPSRTRRYTGATSAGRCRRWSRSNPATS
jgi:hypothetical protein